MEFPYETQTNGEEADHELQIYRSSSYPSSCIKMSSSVCFDLKVFYVKFSNFKVDDLTPEFLTLNHIPLTPNTHLDVNGVRNNNFSKGVSSILRRDRIDKKSEESTFVSTDTIRLTGGLKFEIFNEDDLILSGVLEMSHKKWSMDCESSDIAAGSGFLKGKLVSEQEVFSPKIEIYIAGCFSGNPIILTKTLQLSFRKKHCQKRMLDAIPEYETTECQKDYFPECDFQVADYSNDIQENDDDYSNMFWRTDYIDNEDGELSWFNSGVRVGVGIGLGICLGIGVGVGLLVRTYQATTRTFKSQLMR